MKEDSKIVPSRTILKLLSWFCPDPLYEEIEGDLIYEFNKDVKAIGEKRAKQKLLWNTIRFFRPGIILRNRFSPPFTQLSMLFSYFKIAYRHLMHSKVFSVINVMGLAVGITSFFLILQYVSFEMSYDQFHANGDHIYRVALERYKKNVFQNASSENFAGLRKLVRENFPEADAATGFYKTPANTGVFFKYKGQIYNEPGGELNADSSFFQVFSSLLVKGDPATALADPHSIVLSESMARKIFGHEEPIGQLIQMPNDGNNESDHVVTGIIKDFPSNSHLHAHFIVPLVYNWGQQSEWSQDFLHTYISLKTETDPTQFVDRLNQIYQQLEVQHADMKGAKNFLQPITSIHLGSQLPDEIEVNGNINLVYITFAIGLIILIIAWINYVNLETARFATRAREVGVRRIIGSARSDLAFQFLVEYFCVLLLALALAVLMTGLLVPRFSDLTGIPLTLLQWSVPKVWMLGAMVLLGGSVLAGIYPALFLLRFNPIVALKGNFSGRGGGRYVRRSLLVVQFSSSLILIACVLVIGSQLDFMRDADKKFDVDL